MDGKRQAPKKLIRDVRRRGSWGAVFYEHDLECGHIEIRNRASRSRRIACTWCLQDENSNKTNERVASSAKSQYETEADDADFASSEIELSQVRASLASFLKVPVDAVEIVAHESMGMLELRAAYIFLSARDVRRLLEKGNQDE